jgi:hypothetical protein
VDFHEIDPFSRGLIALNHIRTYPFYTPTFYPTTYIPPDHLLIFAKRYHHTKRSFVTGGASVLFVSLILAARRDVGQAFSFSSIHYAGHNSSCFVSSTLVFLWSILSSCLSVSPARYHPPSVSYSLTFICLCYAPQSRTFDWDSNEDVILEAQALPIYSP